MIPADQWHQAHTLFAIDPGLSSGWALFQRFGTETWQVTACGLATPDTLQCPLSRVNIVVIENPMIYPNSPVPPNDIAKLSRTVGRYEERFGRMCQHMELVHPREWKGTVDGDIFVSRTILAMTADEKRIVAACLKGEAESRKHNAIDAFALGKWALRQSWVRNFRLRPEKKTSG